jgi:hypothetical protein
VDRGCPGDRHRIDGGVPGPVDRQEVATVNDDEFWTAMFLSWLIGCAIFIVLALIYTVVFE